MHTRNAADRRALVATPAAIPGTRITQICTRNATQRGVARISDWTAR